MLTHEQLVQLIYESNMACTCIRSECDVRTCERCAEIIAAQYEEHIRAEERKVLLADIQRYFSRS